MALLARREAIAAVCCWIARGDGLLCSSSSCAPKSSFEVELASPRTNRLSSAIARARAFQGTSEDFDLELFGDADPRGK
jgi:hypothetical protein